MQRRLITHIYQEQQSHNNGPSDTVLPSVKVAITEEYFTFRCHGPHYGLQNQLLAFFPNVPEGCITHFQENRYFCLVIGFKPEERDGVYAAVHAFLAQEAANVIPNKNAIQAFIASNQSIHSCQMTPDK